MDKKKTPRKRKAPITAYDVARVAGVSQSAVSRTFTAGASVSEETRLKVQKAARKLSYRPNFIARSLSTRRSDMIGVIVPPLENHFYPTLLEALSVAFARNGRRILLFTSQSDGSVEPLLEDVLHSRVDAVVPVAASVSSSFADECHKVGLPIVLLNRKTNSHNVSSVATANREGAALIADFLVAGGHKRFGYLAGLETSSTNRDREQAFKQRLQKRDISLSAWAAGNYSFFESMQAAREMLGGKQRPDAIFCCNDHMALALINIAREEFGLKVGQDLSVVGFDNSEMSAWPLFDLTTFAQPIVAMADRVAQLIDAQLAGTERVSEVVVPGELVIRGSARLPPAGMGGTKEHPVWTPPKRVRG